MGTSSELLERCQRMSYLCYGCGICTSSCPVTRVNPDYDPREVIRRVALKREVPAEGLGIWLCSMCYTCQERCPQGLPIADIIACLRNLECKTGKVPQAVLVQLEAVSSSGKTYPLDEFDMKKREKAGLPRLLEKIPEVSLLLEEVNNR